MPRPPKYPGLQQRYEQALSKLLADGQTLKAREILDGVRQKASDFGISPGECDDLDANFANYTARAKDASVVVARGPWGGYKLSSVAGAEGDAVAASPTATELSSADDSAQPSRKPSQYWESFLHLPLTVALSSHFSGRVKSLSNSCNPTKWGNPDMLMLRPSALTQMRDRNPELDPTLFRLVDVTPECILASIEVKACRGRNRAFLFSSISETAANSRWANEAWLVFVDRNPTEQEIDEDVVSLARSVEVGLLEIRVESKDDPESKDGPEDTLRTVLHLRPVLHHAAPTRPTLRVGELGSARADILLAAQDLLRAWQQNDVLTFLDVERAERKGRVLIQQALDNLCTQRRFIEPARLADLIGSWACSDEDRKYVRDLLEATVVSVADAAGVSAGNAAETIKILIATDDTKLVREPVDELRIALDAFETGTASRS
jgi:hypothetical protein